MPTQTTVSGPFRTMRAVSGVHSPRGSSVEQTRIRVFIISESTRARSRRGGRYGPAGLASSEKGVVRLRGLEPPRGLQHRHWRSEEHTSELQSLMRISYAVFCLKKKKTNNMLHM